VTIPIGMHLSEATVAASFKSIGQRSWRLLGQILPERPGTQISLPEKIDFDLTRQNGSHDP
jgi:hypothetical protein